MESIVAVVAVVILVLIVIARTAIVVPQQSAYVVEYLGKYRHTVQAGFHILVPFVEKVAYKHSLKEIAIDIPEQICITRDNVQVGVDGVLYLQDPRRAPRVVRHRELRLRHQAARADHAAQRDRQDRPRPDLRGARDDQPAGGPGARQGLGALGRQGAALRDQEHQSAARRAQRHGEADARRAREARRGPDERGRARRADQPRRGRKAARHQGVRGQASSSRSTRPRARPRPSWPWRRPPPRVCAGSPRRSTARGGNEAMQLRVAEQYVAEFGKLAKAGNTLVAAGQPVGHRQHDRPGDQRDQAAARRGDAAVAAREWPKVKRAPRSLGARCPSGFWS